MYGRTHIMGRRSIRIARITFATIQLYSPGGKWVHFRPVVELDSGAKIVQIVARLLGFSVTTIQYCEKNVAVPRSRL